MESTQSGPGSAEVKPFLLRSVQELYAIPEESIRFLIENLLPTGGFSILVGKPKVGKTTLVRQLAVAVAQGKPFLDRETEPAKVIYMALEEKISEVIKHFRELGLAEPDPLQVYCNPVDKKLAVAMLDKTLSGNPGLKLVIIDPVFRFVHIKDANDYVQVNNALEPILQLARKYEVHILVVHHQKKRESDDVIDGALGSTAISGGVDTFITLRRDSAGIRTLCTRQRYGTDMEEAQLHWQMESRELRLGRTCEEVARDAANVTANRIREEMMLYAVKNAGSTQDGILDAVIGKVTTKKRVLRELIEQKILVQSGAGTKGEPYTYTYTRIPVAKPISD